MADFGTHELITTLALVGGVILVAALLSGFIERSGIPQVVVFLGIGAAIGPAGLGLIDLSVDSPLLRVVATLSLALVLFTDALTLDLREVRSRFALTLRMLGPGTLLTGALMALAAYWLLGLAPAAAVVLGAALASTDPVLLRNLLRWEALPSAPKQGLRLESALNDIVLLPIVMVAMTLMWPGTSADTMRWPSLIIDLFVLGPGAGIAVGLLAVATLDLVRRRVSVRRDYESLYSLGVAFTAFAAAEAVHGSGFLAVFAAGLTISSLDIELCDCFLEYGDTTAEMALLLTFVLFGTSLIWTGLTLLGPATIAFALLAILIRPPAYLLALAGHSIDRKGRLLVSWFGPRGLSSLLLVLLPVFAGVPGSQYLFTVACLVVLFSILLHGGSMLLLIRVIAPRNALARQMALGTQPPDPEESLPAQSLNLTTTSETPVEPAGLERPQAPGETVFVPVHALTTPANGLTRPAQRQPVDRVTLDELASLRQLGERVIIADVRTDRSWRTSDTQAKDAVRLAPDHAVDWAARWGLPKDAWIVLYCT